MGSIDGGARLRPLTAAPPLFFLLSPLGGASEFGSAGSLAVDGLGVAFESDDLSASGSCMAGEGSFLMDDVDCCLDVDDGDDSVENCDSSLGDRCRVMIRDFLAADLGVALGVDIVLVVCRQRWMSMVLMSRRW